MHPLGTFVLLLRPCPSSILLSFSPSSFRQRHMMQLSVRMEEPLSFVSFPPPHSSIARLTQSISTDRRRRNGRYTILPYLGNKGGFLGVGSHFYPSYAHTTLVKVGTLSHTSPSTEWPNGLQGGLNCEPLRGQHGRRLNHII